MKKNRFLLFAFNRYYPKGGCEDLIGSYRHIYDALSHFHAAKETECWSSANILDLDTGKMYLYDEYGDNEFEWKIDEQEQV